MTFNLFVAIFCVCQDILENDDVKLEWMFIASLVMDLVKVERHDISYFSHAQRFVVIAYSVHRLVETWGFKKTKRSTDVTL